jgi:2-polyprenyl-3-methyl-5-hydroxy-6-metoxy-1,4-benzoquinol methylase
MKQTNCKLCGSSEGISVLDVSDCSDTYLDYLNIEYPENGRLYIQCSKCSLVYRNPILTEPEKELLYEKFRDSTLRGENHEEYIQRISSLPPEESENHEKCDFLSKHIDQKGDLLDVGAGMGVFLAAFKRCFPTWNVYGVEPTKGVAELANSHGMTIYEKYLEPDTFKNRTFDLITSIHVLEHTEDPLSHINTLKAYLGADAYLYIETPAVEDIGFLPPSHDRFMCQHDVIFSSNVMSELLARAGLEVVFQDVFLSRRGRNNLRFLAKLG